MVRFILNSRFAVLLALCAMLFSMSACSDDEDYGHGQPPKVERRALAAASIVDASSLVIIGDVAVKTRGEGQDDNSVLHKILESGEMAPVAFKDKDEKEITIRPNFIRNLSEKYVYMDIVACYDTIPADSYSYWNGDYFVFHQDTIAERLSVIVRKEDGAVFSFPRGMIDEDTRFETDYNQNVYFDYSGYDDNNNYIQAVYKMYNYAGRIDVMKATPSDVRVSQWLVDQQGNIAYQSGNTYMCRLAAGEYARFGEPLSCDPFIIKTETQGFYHLKDEWRFPNRTFTILSCYKPKSPTMEKATFEIVDGNWSTNDDLRTIILKDKTIILSNFSGIYAEVMAVFHSQNDYRFFRIRDKSTGKIITWNTGGQVYSDQAAYNFDELGTLRALSFETGEVSVIYENTEYQIRSINVATEKNQDVITFSAMELRTSKDIVAELRDGKVTVLKREDKQQIIQLERIN